MVKSLNVFSGRGEKVWGGGVGGAAGCRQPRLLKEGGSGRREETAGVVNLSSKGRSFWKEQSILRWRRKVRHQSYSGRRSSRLVKSAGGIGVGGGR